VRTDERIFRGQSGEPFAPWSGARGAHCGSAPIPGQSRPPCAAAAPRSRRGRGRGIRYASRGPRGARVASRVTRRRHRDRGGGAVRGTRSRYAGGPRRAAAPSRSRRGRGRGRGSRHVGPARPARRPHPDRGGGEGAGRAQARRARWFSVRRTQTPQPVNRRPRDFHVCPPASVLLAVGRFQGTSGTARRAGLASRPQQPQPRSRTRIRNRSYGSRTIASRVPTPKTETRFKRSTPVAMWQWPASSSWFSCFSCSSSLSQSRST
jgi:hypothetical protein